LELAKLLLYLVRMSRNMSFSKSAIAISVVTGLISGIGLTGWLAIISNVLAGSRDPRLLYAFLALCFIVPINRMISQILFNNLSTSAVFETRLQSCRQVLAAPLRRLEEIGPHRLLATLTDDITTLSNVLAQIPVLCLHVGIIAAGLCYMGWLSWRLLLLVLGFMILGSLTYGVSVGVAQKYYRRLREETDTLFGHLRALIYGAKELKLHSRRRQVFLDLVLIPTGETIRRFATIGNNIFTATAVWGNLLFFIVVGLLVFAFRDVSWVSPRVLTGFAFSLLYMLTPLETIFQIAPSLGRAAVAVRKLDRLGLDLASKVVETWETAARHAPSWQRLEIEDVSYRYSEDPDGEHFNLGPLDLTFHAGEIVFITGGNGSGKSTLAKILTGLYLPDGGRILLDGKPINNENRDAYRQMFATVFTDFYLFESLLGLEQVGLDEAARDYLVRLQLDKQVRVENGVLSTLDLSQGQRKRLALLTAYLEQRPICFFDEWAADQDPHFKAVFYFEILPELKAQGRTVFLISHDDAYYSLADRLFKMNEGQIEWDHRPQAAAQVAQGRT
jgi:putative pyoverdin transport system ATP-binding/permease protein